MPFYRYLFGLFHFALVYIKIRIDLLDVVEVQVNNLFDCNLVTVNIVRMDYRDIITIEPGKRSGKPCIRGMRITVQDVLEYLAGGMTEAEILVDFPELTHEDIRACIAFAANRERQLAVSSQYEVVA